MLLPKYFGKSILGLFLLLLISPLGGVKGETDTASDYYFSVPQEIVKVWINTDGSADIEYWITFAVEGEGDPIDIVDIGFPNKHYDLGSIKADVDGHPVSDIRVSEVISIGVEIHLNQYTITDTGTLHVWGNQPYMIFEDSEEGFMASVEFGNTWWSSKYTTGTTNLTTQIIFPTTVTNSTYTKYHYSDKQNRQYYLDGRKVFEWNEPTAYPYEQYKYGVSFPKEGVEWYTSIPPTLEEIMMIVAFGGVLIIVVVAVIIIYARKRRRLMDYIPPFISIPTAGPRTDLRREEVSIVLEKPVNVTTSLIILSLIKKGLIKQLSPDTPQLMPIEGAPRKHLRKYEQIFLKSIRADFSIDEDDLVKAVTSLVKSTQRRIRGYSYEKTVKHYERLIQDSITKIKEFNPQNVHTEAWFWAILDEDFLPDFELQITEREEYYDCYPWYYHYGYHHWLWVPRGRSFTHRVTKISHPIPRGSSGRSRGGGGCACACAGCACACAGGGR